MNEIRIATENYDKIIVAIGAVEKHCSTRLLAVTDILIQLERVEKYLDILNKSLEGTEATIFPNSMVDVNNYSESPKQTAFSAKYHNGFWHLISVFRDHSYPANLVHLTFSPTAQEDVFKS